MYWIEENIIGITQLILGIFVAYHVFFLSKKISSKARLDHKESIKKKADVHIADIQKRGLNNEIYLVNINRYFKDYPSNIEKNIDGYTHIRAEIKATRFDGIEFFTGVVELYRSGSGKYSLKEEDGERCSFNAFVVGLVPYEWIEHIDLEGDEYAYVPLFYCHFNGHIYWRKNWKRFLPSGYPYKYVQYYKRSDAYHEGSDPKDWKFERIEVSG